MPIPKTGRCTEPPSSAEAVRRRADQLQEDRQRAMALRAATRAQISVFDRLNPLTTTPEERRVASLNQLIEALSGRIDRPQFFGSELCLSTAEDRLKAARGSLAAREAELAKVEAEMDKLALGVSTREWLQGSPRQQQFKALQEHSFALGDQIRAARREVQELQRVVDDRRWLEGRLALIRG